MLFWNGQSFLPVNSPGLQIGLLQRRGDTLVMFLRKTEKSNKLS